jgi:hypothetical protein
VLLDFMRRIFAVMACCCGLLGWAGPVMAQQKIIRKPAVWPELQVDYVFKSTSFIFFRNHYRHVLDNDYNQLREKGALQYLERVQFRLGYEHVFNPNWSGGLSESYALERTRKILFNEVFARHTGALGKFRFSERASFEHLVRWPKNNNGRFRLRLDLDRAFQLGGTSLRPRASYELFYNLTYHPQADPATETRWVDRSRLRLDCQVVLSNKVTFTPYFIRQADYFIVEPAFDENNAMTRPGGKQTHMTPVWGLELRYSVFAGGEPFARTLPLNK